MEFRDKIHQSIGETALKELREQGILDLIVKYGFTPNERFELFYLGKKDYYALTCSDPNSEDMFTLLMDTWLYFSWKFELIDEALTSAGEYQIGELKLQLEREFSNIHPDRAPACAVGGLGS